MFGHPSLALAAAAVLLSPIGLLAQDAGLAPQWEFHVHGTFAVQPAAHAALGVNVRTGTYVRSGIAAGLGLVRRDDGAWVSSERLDLAARFLLDPFGERPRGYYGGAGLTLRRDGGDTPRPRLLVVVGVEGSMRRRQLPSFEVGMGDGVRVGLVLRARRRDATR